jgi:hypothetical protein
MAGSDDGRSPAYESYLRLIRQVDDLVASFDDHPDEATRERVAALLGGIDLLHREGLTRLSEGLKNHGMGPVLEAVAGDPVVRTLLGLYDLAELDLPEEPAPEEGVTFIPRERLTMGRGGVKG